MTKTYSPGPNRDRVVYIAHPGQECGKLLCDEFLFRGFQVSLMPDVESVVRLAAIRRPDLVLLPICFDVQDADRPLATLEAIRALHLAIPVYVLAPESIRAELICEALKSGATYAFSPPYTAASIVEAAQQLLQRDVNLEHKDGIAVAVRIGFGTLTRRERQILQMIVSGSTNKEIGLQVGISYRTVEVHRRSLLSKTGARNTAELVRLAIEG